MTLTDETGAALTSSLTSSLPCPSFSFCLAPNSNPSDRVRRPAFAQLHSNTHGLQTLPTLPAPLSSPAPPLTKLFLLSSSVSPPIRSTQDIGLVENKYIKD